jgi:hypothetical protein
VVQEKVLDKIDSDKLQVFVIWLPMVEGDSRTIALKSTKLISDKRARHFWDPDKKAALAFAQMLQSSFPKAIELPKGEYPAWDVYLVYDVSTKWKDAVPVPSDWMHQLGGVDPARRLDGDKLRGSVLKLLKAKAVKQSP